MFDLDKAIVRWRRKLERHSGLAPREVDELEDHLRARVELEMELDAGLSPARALAIARDDIGQAPSLSREFAKVGKPRWRRWLVAGWAMFGVSFVLPAFRLPAFWGMDFGWDYGYELFWDLLTDAEGIPMLLPSLAMILSTRALLSPSPGKGRWLGRILGTAGSLGVVFGLLGVVRTWGSSPVLGIGYWMWTLSLLCVAVALRIRNRDWASEPRPAAS